MSQDIDEDAPMTEHEIKGAHDGWMKAIEEGDECLAEYMIADYPELDFLKFYWPDGSNALQVA